MAPEQIAGGEPGPAADVFALGATLAVACSGKPPFDGDSVPSVLHAVVHEEPDLSAVPPGLRGLIGACLAKDPALRPTPQAVSTFLGAVPGAARPWPEAVHARIAAQRAEVDRLVRTAPAAASPSLPLRAPGPAPRRRRRPVAAAVAAGVLVVAGAVSAATGWAADLYYLVVPEPVPTPGDVPLSEVPDRYTGALPTCEQVSAQVKVPAGFALRPTMGSPMRVTPYNGTRSTQCTWITRSGDRINATWDQHDSAGGRTGTERAKEDYEEFYRRGVTLRDSSLGFAEEALWEKPRDQYCVLRGRDGNLVLFLVVQGPVYPVGRCEAVTTDVGRQAMAAVKSR
ncbi:hypothetical protein Shyd_40510 [Streptomyces hydrogenans]|nr:hypothetical protein [Streptomyces hydrogenans]GHI22680.1 hypothetical protein Shyd_40510 [Streptomyces hydrogenans]